MGKIQIISQKIKGQAQEVKGEIEVAVGEPIHGNIDKVRGKANEIAANIKMNIKNSKS
jgi:uncharacterized protein YjbJ (UPF0337 family)